MRRQSMKTGKKCWAVCHNGRDGWYVAVVHSPPYLPPVYGSLASAEAEVRRQQAADLLRAQRALNLATDALAAPVRCIAE